MFVSSRWLLQTQRREKMRRTDMSNFLFAIRANNSMLRFERRGEKLAAEIGEMQD